MLLRYRRRREARRRPTARSGSTPGRGWQERRTQETPQERSASPRRQPRHRVRPLARRPPASGPSNDRKVARRRGLRAGPRVRGRGRGGQADDSGRLRTGCCRGGSGGSSPLPWQLRSSLHQPGLTALAPTGTQRVGQSALRLQCPVGQRDCDRSRILTSTPRNRHRARNERKFLDVRPSARTPRTGPAPFTCANS